MATFSQITKQRFSDETPLNVNLSIVEDKIGEMDVSEITSKEISSLFAYLYDEYKIVGVSLTRYKKSVYEVLKYAQKIGEISQIPQIKNRTQKKPNLYNKPDVNAIETALTIEHLTPSATIVNLALKAGLLREEIRLLKWEDIDFKNHQIILPDRTIRLVTNLEYYLQQLYDENRNYSDYVLISSRTKKGPWSKESISNAVRIFMKKIGQNNVRLNDLRTHFIIGLLKKYNMEVASYISGVNDISIKEHYLPYLDADVQKPQKTKLTDEKRKVIEEMLSKKSIDNETIAIRLIWKLGIQFQAIPTLKWELIDFENERMEFSDRVISLDDETLNLLLKLKKGRKGHKPNILLTENSAQPIDRIFLEKAIRNKLVRNEVFGIGVGELYSDYWRSNIDELVELKANVKCYKSGLPDSVTESLLNEHSFISSEKMMRYVGIHKYVSVERFMSDFGMSENDAKVQLKYATNLKLLKQLGDRYYNCGYELTQTELKETIKEYFINHQPLRISNIVDMQAPNLINEMLKDGDIVKTSEEDYVLRDYVEEKGMLQRLSDENSTKITEYLKSHRVINSSSLSQKLNISSAQAERILDKYTQENILEKHMGRYYLKGTITDKKERDELIIRFADEHQPFKVTEVAKELGLCNEWTRQKLNDMVNNGELAKPLQNTYCLPEYVERIGTIENLLCTDVGQKQFKKLAHDNIITGKRLTTEYKLSNGQANILLKILEKKKTLKKHGDYYLLVEEEKNEESQLMKYIHENLLATSFELKEYLELSENGIRSLIRKLTEADKLTKIRRGIYCEPKMVPYINIKKQKLLNQYGSEVMDYLYFTNTISNQTIQEKYSLTKTESNILLTGLLQNNQIRRIKKEIYSPCKNLNNQGAGSKDEILTISAKRIGEILDVDDQLKHRIINELLNANRLIRVGKGVYSLAKDVTVKDDITIENAVIKANDELVAEKMNLIKVYIIQNGFATSKEISNIYNLEIHYIYYILQLMQEKDIIYREGRGKYKVV